MSLPLSHVPARPAVPTAGDASVSPVVTVGPSADRLLSLVLGRVQTWAPSGSLRAVVLAGSLSRGDEVWARTATGARLLSDIDVYAILRDGAACSRARLAARAGMPGLLAEAHAAGLWAPIDLGWLGEGELARLPARPGTLELSRGRSLWGDAGLLGRIPRRVARDVSAEEILLLAENRAADLLLARAWLERGGEPGAWRALHASVKTALDLAGLLGLLEGRWPEQAGDRVADATTTWHAGGALAVCAPRLPELWTRALAWRATPEASDAASLWRETVNAWTCVWLELGRRLCAERGNDPYVRLAGRARRARWRRRMRRNLALPRPAAGPEPLPLVARFGRAALGTPQHRVNACAGALLFSAAEGGPGRPVLGPRAARTLRRLAPFRPPGEGDWESWRRAVVAAWDGWFQDGQRAAEAP